MPRIRKRYDYDPRLDMVKREAEAQLELFDQLPKWARDLLNTSPVPQDVPGFVKMANNFEQQGLSPTLFQQFAEQVLARTPSALTERNYAKTHPNCDPNFKSKPI